MAVDHKRIQELVEHLAESLNVEVKTWISPDDQNEAAKIVRAVFALRNRNGGFLVIGFDNKTLQPDIGHRPPDVKSQFHIDKIQGLISKYASELFEIEVAFPSLDGREYPVIVVPEGVTAPVAAKSDLFETAGKALIRVGEAYFRTLAANGTPSTAVARPQDWREIVEICFENREADFGRFLRRQLAGADIAKLTSILSTLGLVVRGGVSGELKATEGSDKATFNAEGRGGPGLRDRTLSFLSTGEGRFKRALSGRHLKPEEKTVVEGISWEVALVIDPPRSQTRPDEAFFLRSPAAIPN